MSYYVLDMGLQVISILCDHSSNTNQPLSLYRCRRQPSATPTIFNIDDYVPNDDMQQSDDKTPASSTQTPPISTDDETNAPPPATSPDIKPGMKGVTFNKHSKV